MADLQAAGLAVKDHVPEKVVPPLVLMSADDPMLEESETMDPTEFEFHLNLLVLIGTRPNSDTISALEAMVEKVLFNLGEWTVKKVGPVVMMTANDSVFPSVEISISKTITIEGGS